VSVYPEKGNLHGVIDGFTAKTGTKVVIGCL
jgi:hypothetical protein